MHHIFIIFYLEMGQCLPIPLVFLFFLTVLFSHIPTQVIRCMKWVREWEIPVDVRLKTTAELKEWVRGRERVEIRNHGWKHRHAERKPRQVISYVPLMNLII